MKQYKSPEMDILNLSSMAALCASQTDPSSQSADWMYDDSYNEME